MSFHPKSLEEARAKFRPMGRGKPMSRGRSPMGHGRKQMNRSTKMKSYSKPQVGVRDLERTLDDLTRKVLRQDERVCFTDGRRGTADDPLEVSHLFGRAFRPTRFDVHPDGNNHMMHRFCNRQHNEDQSIYRDKFIERCGQDAYDEIERRVHQGGVFEYIQLLRMIEQREAMLK